MKSIIVKKIKLIFFLVFLISAKTLYAEGYVLEGKVYNRVTMKPVDMASVVIIEAKVKARTGSDGKYRIIVPETGDYTVIVKSDGR